MSPYWLSSAERSALKPYTHKQQKHRLSGVGGAYTHTYICNNHNQRERERREDMEGGELEGARGRKESGESDLILFQYKTYEK